MSKLDVLLDRRDAEKWAHPEVKEAYQFLEAYDSKIAEYFGNTNIPFEERRKAIVEQRKANEALLGVKSAGNEMEIPGCDDEPDVPSHVVLVSPKERKKKKMPCLFCVPGGGLINCTEAGLPLEELAETFNAVAVMPKYRTVFDEKGGYPGTINDLGAAYKWVIDNAAEYGINTDKIVIYGVSSGGHLALALSHRLKKKNYYGHQPKGCVVICPIVDDRTIYPSSKDFMMGWAGRDVFATSQAWLGYDHSNPAFVPAEAFPNHATPEECVGLPPTFINTFDAEPSMDPCLIYYSKLIEAGVFADIHVWGGNSHGSMGTTKAMPEFGYDSSDYVQRWWRIVAGQISDCLKYDLRRQWITKAVEESTL